MSWLDTFVILAILLFGSVWLSVTLFGSAICHTVFSVIDIPSLPAIRADYSRLFPKKVMSYLIIVHHDLKTIQQSHFFTSSLSSLHLLDFACSVFKYQAIFLCLLWSSYMPSAFILYLRTRLGSFSFTHPFYTLCPFWYFVS